MSPLPETVAPIGRAKSAGTNIVHTRAFELSSRAGFIARGIVYAIIGLLALDVAIGHGGKITNQQGALRSIEHQPFGHFLLALVAIGAEYLDRLGTETPVLLDHFRARSREGDLPELEVRSPEESRGARDPLEAVREVLVAGRHREIEREGDSADPGIA